MSQSDAWAVPRVALASEPVVDLTVDQRQILITRFNDVVCQLLAQ